MLSYNNFVGVWRHWGSADRPLPPSMFGGRLGTEAETGFLYGDEGPACYAQALKHMQQDKTDRGAALREAGMRQHDRIIDAATAVRGCLLV